MSEYIAPSGDAVSLAFDGEYTPPAGDQVALAFGPQEQAPSSTFSISVGAAIQLEGKSPSASAGSVSSGAQITLIGKMPPASAGSISAGPQITLTGFIEVQGSWSISAGINARTEALTERQGTLWASEVASITGIGSAPVVPNLPTKWVYICPDPVIKVYPNNVHDPCAVEPDRPPQFLTSPLYPVQFIDEMAASGAFKVFNIWIPPVEEMESSGEVVGINLRTTLVTYEEWPPEESESHGEFVSINLRQILRSLAVDEDELSAHGAFGSINLKRILVTYPNWPLIVDEESYQSHGSITGINLQ